MNFKKCLIGALSVLLLASCSSDDAQSGGIVDGTNGSVYAKIKVQLPNNGSPKGIKKRSNTTDYDGNTNSSNGFEIGKDRENYIGSLTLVLALKDGNAYKPIAVSSQGVSMPSPTSDNIYTIMFNDKEILKAAAKDVYVFAYCNATLTFDDAADLLAGYGTIDSENASIWQDNNFLMVNAPNEGLTQKTMPSETSLRNDYNTAEKALNLGTVKVARVSARFDFKNNNGDDKNLYHMYDVNATEKNETSRIADIELLGMAPFNIAKEYYYIPRVSADGTSTGWDPCGFETASNYVVSPNFGDKTGTLTATSALLGKYFLQLNSKNYSLNNYTMLSTFNGENDNDENWTVPEGQSKEGYQIWCYVTENTLPTSASQKSGITTGVVFKAEIKNAKGLMAEAMTAKKAVYAFNGVYYGDVDALRLKAAKEPTGSKLREAFLKVFGNTSLDYTINDDKESEDFGKIVFTESISDCTAEANANTFKILRPTDGHYYVYYVYYNRHNDNNNPSSMGAMEFATVRNNIYKLAVTSISDFGHTDNPGDDPDPENPDNPDEEEKIYFKVSCQVLPWMVRVNNIEF